MDYQQGKYKERFYREWSFNDALHRFEVKIKESDLLILCDRDLKDEAMLALKQVRKDIESHIALYPVFGSSLRPVSVPDDAPLVIKSMASAGYAWNVGPMASVAGAVAEHVGRALLQKASSVLVENGGDIFALSPKPVRFGLYAGEDSPFKSALTFAVHAETGIGICTSSGKVGPSLSFGKADAVAAVHRDAAVADAAATAAANRIQIPSDVAVVVEEERERGLLAGLIACCGDKLGMWGDLELVK